jgi:hypothetical protein
MTPPGRLLERSAWSGRALRPPYPLGRFAADCGANMRAAASDKQASSPVAPSACCEH